MKKSILVRLSIVESKLDRVLCLLEDRRELPPGVPDISSEVMQDAIRAHIHGDRGPIDALDKIWQLQQKEGL